MMLGGILEGSKIRKTSLDVFHDLDREKKEDDCGNYYLSRDLNCKRCSKAYRKTIQKLRTSSLASLSIYTEIFVADGRFLFLFFYFVITVIIQILIPAAIIWTQQPIEDIVESPKACPNQSTGFTKFLALTLCLFFVRITNDMCNHKLSGLMFLRTFCNLGKLRRIILDVGILNQMIAMTVAGGAQFLLFVGNGRGDYLILLLQSLAMQFCLSVDTKVLMDPEETRRRVKAFTQDSLLADGAGIGDEGELMPTVTAKKLGCFVRLEAAVNMSLLVTGLLWSAALAYCV